MSVWHHPSVWLIAGAFLSLIVRQRRVEPLLAPLSFFIASLVWMFLPTDISFSIQTPFHHELHLISFSPYSRLFGFVFLLIGFLASVFGATFQKSHEKCFALIYASGALGVTLAGDWITFLGFWELMTVSSFLLIWSGSEKGAKGAAFRYLLIHAAGGALLLLGIFSWLGHGQGVLLQSLTRFQTQEPFAFYCILAGVLINAAAIPLHNWLTDSYPKSSVSGGVYLSALTTKTAVFALLLLFPGAEILMVVGSVMALYGVVYAMMQNHLRTLLAYHIVSQVGFMVAGVGIGTELSLNGSAAHAFCHILYKGLLFMAAGSFLYKYRVSKLTEFSGEPRRDRWIWLFYLVGAVSIAGIPGFNGFVSKPMILEAAHSSPQTLHWVYYILKLASIGTFLSVALKVPYLGFSWRDESTQKTSNPVQNHLPHSMLFGMGTLAALCLLLGIYPDILYRHLPYAVQYEPYSMPHLLHDGQIFLGAFVGFWVLKKAVKVKDVELLDFEYLYRKPLTHIMNSMVRLSKLGGQASEWFMKEVVISLAEIGDNPFRMLPARKKRDEESRTPGPIGQTILWVLGAFSLALFYLGTIS